MPEAEAATATADPGPESAVAEALTERPAEHATDATTPIYAPDPRSTISVSLSDYRGGSRMHLLRSHKFKQMQIRFDGEQPVEHHLARLHEMGWKDRTESEGVWTKQIDPSARWQSVQQMEREFREVANAIRKEKGLSRLSEVF